MIDLIQNWDRALFLFINHDCAVRALDVFFITITNTKFWIIPWIGMAVLFLMKEKKKAAIVLLAVVATFAITDPLASQIIKPMVHRLRPCTAEGLVEGGRYLVGVGGRLSFPSNHAMNMFGMATVLALFYRRNAVWFFLFAGMIGYSRVYVGVHYPGDVLAGAVFGVIVGSGVYWIFRLVKKQANLVAPPVPSGQSPAGGLQKLLPPAGEGRDGGVKKNTASYSD